MGVRIVVAAQYGNRRLEGTERLENAVVPLRECTVLWSLLPLLLKCKASDVI